VHVGASFFVDSRFDAFNFSARLSARLFSKTAFLRQNALHNNSTNRRFTMTEQPIAALLCAAFLVGAPVAAFAQASAPTQAASTTAANPLPDVDKAFVQAASMSSSTEIDAAKLALTHSKTSEVRSFASHMIMDHTKLTAELKLKAPHGVQVPKDNSDTELIQSLKGQDGDAFDDDYVRKVGLEGHKQAVAAFEKEARDGQNPDLKKLAQSAFPTIKHHLAMAEQLAKYLHLTQ